jgi:hypothetical protein
MLAARSFHEASPLINFDCGSQEGGFKMRVIIIVLLSSFVLAATAQAQSFSPYTYSQIDGALNFLVLLEHRRQRTLCSSTGASLPAGCHSVRLQAPLTFKA